MHLTPLVPRALTLIHNISLSAVSWSPGRVDLFGLGTDSACYHKWLASQPDTWGPSMTDWEWHGGIFKSEPTAVSWGPNRLDVFGVGDDTQLYHQYWNGGTWLPAINQSEPLGGALTSRPAVVSWGSGRVDVFALGKDSACYHKWLAPSPDTWSPSLTAWEAHGGHFLSEPVAVSWGPNRLDVFGIGDDRQMYHQYWNGGAWLPAINQWEVLGGAFHSSPAVVSWGSGRIDIFALGLDDQMYHKWYDNGWSPGWEPQGGVFHSSPAAVSWGSGRIDIFALGLDDQMYHRWYDNGWSPDWEPHGGAFTSEPTAVTWGSSRIDVFGRGINGQMYHQYWNGRTWLPAINQWESLGGVFLSGKQP